MPAPRSDVRPDTPGLYIALRRWLLIRAAESAAAGYVLLIVWGSLIAPSGRASTGERWFVAHSRPLTAEPGGLADVATNLALYFPLGFLFVVCMRRRGAGAFAAWARSLILCAALSLVLEMLQIYVPFRFSSCVDWACNATGAAVGGLVGVALFSSIRVWWRTIVRPLLVDPYLFAAALWFVFVVLTSWWPLEVPLRPAELAAANPPGSAALLGRWDLHRNAVAAAAPMSFAYAWRLQIWWEYGLTLVATSAVYIVFGWLIARALRQVYAVSRAQALATTAWIGAATVAAMAAGRAVLPSAGLDLTWLLVATAGCVLGGVCACRGPALREAPPWQMSRRLLKNASIGVAVYIGLREVVPFVFVPGNLSFSGVISQMDWVPLHAYFMERLPRGVEHVGVHLALWGIVGFLVAGHWRIRSERELWDRTFALAGRIAVAAMFLELLQTQMPTRVADITDVLLAIVGGAGAAFLRRWWTVLAIEHESDASHIAPAGT